MDIFRSERNPIITPEDIKPSRPDFKVVSVFNCSVTRFNGEILLLMRVAEIPIRSNPKKELVPMLDIKTDKLIVKEFDKADSLAIFPEKIKDKYYALNRPVSAEYKVRDMWISESPDLVYWGSHMKLMGTRRKYWDNRRFIRICFWISKV